MPQRAQGPQEAGTSYGHHLVDGEWIELVADGRGNIVIAESDWSDPDNWIRPETLNDFGRYEFTMIVDGVPVHAYEGTVLAGHEFGDGVGRLTYRTDEGADGDLGGEVIEVPEYAYTVVTDEGTLEHRYGRNGYLTLDDEQAPITTHSQEARYEIRFESFAEYEGRRAVVGVDGDGDQVLLTPSGHPVEVDVDWSAVRLFETPVLEGDPIAIGDYALDPGSVDGVERVYLFPDGSQAIKDDAGEYQRVIVPTDVEYPEGRPVFQGRFYAGEDRTTVDRSDSEYASVFAFADGQTATWVDGELVLVDMPIEVDYPTGAPVACGKFPGGDLFVFEDGTQLLRAPNGQWGIGTFSDLPPYEDLVERFGEPDLDALDEDGMPEPVPNDDLLVDDITDVTLLPTASHEPDEPLESVQVVDPDSEPVDDGPVPTAESGDDGLATVEEVATDPLASDPFSSDPTELSDPFADDRTGTDPVESLDGLGGVDDGLLDDA